MTRNSLVRLFLALALLAPGVLWADGVQVSDRSSLDSGARLKHAYAMALDETEEWLYVSGYDSHNILGWDLGKRNTFAAATGFRYPFFLKYHPVRKRLFALAYNENGDALLIIFDKNLKELRRVPLGAPAYSLALSKDGLTAYVGVLGALLAVNTEDGAKTTLGALGSYYFPFSVVNDDDRNRVLVVGMGWFDAAGAWVLRSAVLSFDLARNEFTGAPLVLGDKLFSMDAVLDRDELYIANTDDNSVSIVDAARMEVAGKITGVSCPQKLVLHPGRKWLYVIDNYLDRFHVIDRVHRTLTKTLYPGDDPSGLVCSSKGRCYTANYWSDDITVVDIDAEEIEDRISLAGVSPQNLFYDPKAKRIYFTNGTTNGIYVMDAERGAIVDKLVMPDGAHGGPLTVDPERKRIFMVDDGRGGVGVYPTDSSETSFQASHAELKFITLSGAHPSAIAEDGQNRLLVPFVKGDRLALALFDKKKEELEREIDLGPGLQTGGVAVSAKKNRAYVADYSGARLVSVDLKKNEVTGGVSVERKPTALAIHPVTGYVYVCNPGSKSIAVVADEPLETLGFIDVGNAPASIAFGPAKARIYVINEDGTITIVNELNHQVVETLPVADSAQAVVVDEETEDLFVASPAGGQVVTVRDGYRLSAKLNNGLKRVDPSFRFQNVYAYPNPARKTNPSVRVEVGVADSVQISIYDVSGRLVHEAVVTDAPAEAEGRYVYEYVWDAADAPSGIYLVSVRALKAGEKDILKTLKLAVLK
ncbi:MAG: T9SS type A sorting domain-containing protein [Elusimicrobia bacterium]|nr:T9SS type A sorting domain-containing protein [Elusimicrobiota bacterium]